jgi:hypothetical protein
LKVEARGKEINKVRARKIERERCERETQNRGTSTRERHIEVREREQINIKQRCERKIDRKWRCERGRYIAVREIHVLVDVKERDGKKSRKKKSSQVRERKRGERKGERERERMRERERERKGTVCDTRAPWTTERAYLLQLVTRIFTTGRVYEKKHARPLSSYRANSALERQCRPNFGLDSQLRKFEGCSLFARQRHEPVRKSLVTFCISKGAGTHERGAMML